MSFVDLHFSGSFVRYCMNRGLCGAGGEYFEGDKAHSVAGMSGKI
jgi:hypothetical protein